MADQVSFQGLIAGQQNIIQAINKTNTALANLTTITFVAAPASSSSAGTAGQLAYDVNYLYLCVNTGVWKRVALSSW